MMRMMTRMLIMRMILMMMMTLLPMAMKTSLTLRAVLAEVSRNSRLLSSA